MNTLYDCNGSWYKTKLGEISSTHPKTAMEVDIKQKFICTRLRHLIIAMEGYMKQSWYKFHQCI